MAKITEIRDEVLNQISVNSVNNRDKKRILVFDGGNLTSFKRPWFRTLITDSDQGSIIVFVLSSTCYEDKYKDKVVRAMIDSVTKHRIISLDQDDSLDQAMSDKPDQSTKKEADSQFNPSAPRKRGRPKKKK